MNEYNGEPTWSEYSKWLHTEYGTLPTRFPIGASIEIKGKKHYVFGYAYDEDDREMIGVTPIDPALDYDKAIAMRGHVHVDCLER